VIAKGWKRQIECYRLGVGELTSRRRIAKTARQCPRRSRTCRKFWPRIAAHLQNFNKTLTSLVRSFGLAFRDEQGCAMDGISWTDLDSDEQRAVAILAEGASTDLCDPVALLTLRRVGLVRGTRLTPAAEQILSQAVRNAFAASAVRLAAARRRWTGAVPLASR
jgi:hypothetical protein